MNRLPSFLLFLLLSCLPAGCASTPTAFDESLRPVRHFRLRFQYEDFVVPEGVTWKLTWRSPYKPCEIHPGYDVRVIEGRARLGERGGLSAQSFDPNPSSTGLLDLLAISTEEVVVWLDAGTHLMLANDRVDVRTDEYRP